MYNESLAPAVTGATSRHSVVRASAARTGLWLTAVVALAACNDLPVQPKLNTPNVPGGGAKAPSAVINIIPPGTTFPTKIAFATGSPVGKEAKVRLYDKNGTQLAVFYAFSGWEDFFAGVDVAVADVTGDGWPDIVAGEGPTPKTPYPGSQINIWDGKTGTLLKTLTPLSDVKDGWRVGTGDLDGDGKADILGCQGPGATTHGVAMKLDGTALNWMTMVDIYGWKKDGCHIAGGDINGDGKDEMVAEFDGQIGGLTLYDHANQLRFGVVNPLGNDYHGQMSIALGDVNGDKKDDIILAPLTPTSNAPVVSVFDGTKVQNSTPLTKLTSFTPYTLWWKSGVHVAAHDIKGDGVVEILTKPTNEAYSSMASWVAPSFTSWLFFMNEPGNLPAGGGIG